MAQMSKENQIEQIDTPETTSKPATQKRDELAPVKAALHRYREVFVSGLVVAAVLAIFRYLSGSAASEYAKFQNSITLHSISLPWLIVDITAIVAGLSLAIAVPWGAVLQKHVIKPLLELLLHNFGIAAGFVCFMWATSPSSWTLDVGPSQAATFALLQFLLLMFGFFIAIGADLCEHGIDLFFSPQEIEEIGPRVPRMLLYAALPGGVLLMWVGYQDLLRQLGRAASGH